jgi:hypothetical protein
LKYDTATEINNHPKKRIGPEGLTTRRADDTVEDCHFHQTSGGLARRRGFVKYVHP